MTDARHLRAAILATPLESSNFGENPRPGTHYIPPSHRKALRLEANLVIGGRGVGKTFWTATLNSLSERPDVGDQLPELKGIEVVVGFAEKGQSNNFPDADAFSALIGQGFDPYDIWRAVILRWVARRDGRSIPDTTWSDTIGWLKSGTASAARVMETPRDWRGLILFDALDRTSTDWLRMDEIVRGLLRAVLWLKSWPGLHGKVFLREDQAERTVFNFPDASKLTATRAELTWARYDLHGLLWQRLIHAPDPHGARMRDICGKAAGREVQRNGEIWSLPDELKRESDAQKIAFERLAGTQMGRGVKRGVPYTWSVSHLEDARGQASPRSFLAAIKQATEDTEERYPDHELALHFESIKRGIQKASEIRVSEIAEDYPWVREVLEPLRGLNVPCESDTFVERWNAKFPNGPGEISTKSLLPAQHLKRGWQGIHDDLRRLGMIEIKKTDGRTDMPDLYRVGFGLGRKGGVKPKIG